MLVSSPWHCKMCSRFASKRGGCPKAVLVSSGVAQNCASKLRETILLRDPLTIPERARTRLLLCTRDFFKASLNGSLNTNMVSRCELGYLSAKIINQRAVWLEWIPKAFSKDKPLVRAYSWHCKSFRRFVDSSG